MQQYKFKRNFPYNNTIKEDSAEHLSENKSANTFNSGYLNQNIRVMQRIGSGETDSLNFKKEFVNMKSDHYIQKYEKEMICSEGTSPYQTQELKVYSQRYTSNNASPINIQNDFFEQKEVNLFKKK